MLSHRPDIQSGFTLTELMVSSAVGLIILSGTASLYGSLVRAGSISLMEAYLNNELRGTMDLITRDLRRAGYWAGEPDTHNPVTNPFFDNENNLSISAKSGEAGDSCITFAYDRDRDTKLGVGSRGKQHEFTDRDNVEQYGFRLHNGAVESRISGSRPSCNGGRWQDVTSHNLEITALQFVLRLNSVNLSRPEQECIPNDYCQLSRHVEIILMGQVPRQPQTQRTLTNSVQLRNDRITQISH